MKRFCIGVFVVVALGAQAAAGAGHVTVLHTFDESVGENVEGVAVSKRGDVFVSQSFLGRLVKFPKRGGPPEVIGTIPGLEAGEFGLLGLTVDAPGNVYGAVLSAASQGVWRFDRRSGEPTRLPGTEVIGFPNDLTFDQRGNLYVTSSYEGDDAGGALGGIWRIDRKGAVEPWFVDTVIGGTGDFGLGPIGANGIAFHRGSLIVAVTEKGRLVRIPVLPDGGPGEPEVLVDDPALVGADGIAVDTMGDVWVAVIAASAVFRIDLATGEIEAVASRGAGDPLDWVSTIAFGTGNGQRHVLYAVNFSIGEFFGDFTPGAGPGLIAIATDRRGDPVP